MSVSEKYTAALNCYTHVAKTLTVNYEITAHRLWEIVRSVNLSAKVLNNVDIVVKSALVLPK